MHFIDVRGLSVAYADTGQRTTGQDESVLLAHCSSASHKAWRPLVARLADRYRVVTPDLISYGRSDPWPDYSAYEPDADVHVLEALIERLDGPVHLVGHSYGGAMSLEAARRQRHRVASLTLVEPVSFHLLRLAGRDQAWAEILGVARSVQAAVAAGRTRAAAAAHMGYWVGRHRWWLMPKAIKQTVMRSIDKVAVEFGAMEQADGIELGDYLGLDVPVRLLVGGKTRRPTRAVVEVLADLLPKVEVREIAGAGHMSPFTHREAVNGLLADHIERHRVGAAELAPDAIAA